MRLRWDEKLIEKCLKTHETGDVSQLLSEAGFTEAEIQNVFCSETGELFIKELKLITFEKYLERIRARNSACFHEEKKRGLERLKRRTNFFYHLRLEISARQAEERWHKWLQEWGSKSEEECWAAALAAMTA